MTDFKVIITQNGKNSIKDMTRFRFHNQIES